MNNNTLVIGGSGFVGSFLIQELDLKTTKNFDKAQSPFFKTITTIGNVLDEKALNIAMENVKTVVLLAAEHSDNVTPNSLYYDVNVTGAKNVLKAMDKHHVNQLIFTSSVAVYGLNKENPDETHPGDPFNHYGKSKWQAEQVIKNWYDENPENKSVTILRPTVIFGERNRGNVYNLLKQIASGKFVMIGKGNNKKSMAYVRNVVAFIKQAMIKAEAGFHVFNYVDTPDFSINELVAVVTKKMSSKIPKQKIPYWIGMLGGYGFDMLAFLRQKKLSISSVRVKKFCATTQFNAEKAHKAFNAPFSLEKGLSNTLEHEFLSPKKDEVLFYSE